MSKIKVSSVNPRFERGTTYIGEEGSTTHFHPHSTVILHDYADKDWVLDQITGSDIDLSEYLTTEAAQELYAIVTYGPNEPMGQHVEDLWFNSDTNIMYICTAVDTDPAGLVKKQHWQSIAPEQVEDTTKADKVYVDAQDDDIKKNYLPLSGGVDHKMTADMYMQQNHIKGIADDPDHLQDAVNQKYVDAADDDIKQNYLPLTGGDVSGTITFTGPDRRLNSANGLAGQLAYDNKIKFQWGSVQNVSKQAISMDNHAIHNLYMPTDDKDAANKKYVDDNVGRGGGGVEVGDKEIPPDRPRGTMYMTTSGTVYIYT